MVHLINRGLFITLEGGEGVGKSTQLRCLTEALRRDGKLVCSTREPGGTPGAEALRQQLLFGEAPLSWKAEVMTHMAARCDHLDQKIIPALTNGHIVVCDRFHDSTWAYQGYGRGEGNEEKLSFIRSLRQLVGHEPDITFWFDLPVEEAQRRVGQRGGKTDRYEGKKIQFHRRVREGFLRAYETQDRERIYRIDASQSEEDIQRYLFEQIKKVMCERPA